MNFKVVLLTVTVWTVLCCSQVHAQTHVASESVHAKVNIFKLLKDVALFPVKVVKDYVDDVKQCIYVMHKYG